MADPRKVVEHEGIDAEYATFKHDATIVYDATKAGGSASVDLAVTLTGANIVGLTTDASAIEGKLILVEADGYCNVMTRGFTRLPAGDGATVTNGTKLVGALGADSAKGYVRNVNTAVAAELGKMDATAHDVTDTTKVVVELH